MMARDRQGLSPLARGNLHTLGFPVIGRGPIPARTGQPGCCWWRTGCTRAYPRSHGATDDEDDESFVQPGLSPLARGNPHTPAQARVARGPIPARTGQPHWDQCGYCWPRAYPRSHGATLATRSFAFFRLGLSPLARGNRGGAGHDG